jgi:hypothetical protein
VKTIRINGLNVTISIETFKRIKVVAHAKKISVGKAVEFCLERVI